METGSLKALAKAVLHRNRAGNSAATSLKVQQVEFPGEFLSQNMPWTQRGASFPVQQKPQPDTQWHVALAQIRAAQRPSTFAAARWSQILSDADRFVDHWSREAEQNGWTLLDVFGCDAVAPTTRVDHAGVILLLRGAEVVRISADRILTRQGSSALLSIYARRRMKTADAVLLWQLTSSRGE